MRGERLAGIDGCRSGWMCVSLLPDTGDVQAVVLPRLEKLLDFMPAPAVIAMDIPMGLTDAGARSCESEARKFLGRPGSSSIFPTPIRPMLRAASYKDACRIGQRADGRGLSRQTWGIVPKIREADALLRSHADLRSRIWEVHPEVSFREWSGVVLQRKKSAQGRAEREKLVMARFGARARTVLASLAPGGWAHDDFLDAFACLWTAMRIAEHRAVSMPGEPPVDGFGLRMAITY